MSAKIIVSYDGTANEDDAVALGRLFARAGGEVSIAYVRHTQEADSERETLAQNEAQELLERGAALFGPTAPGAAPIGLHVVTDRSTPVGLAALAERQGADVIVFCSDSHTAKGHVAIGNSAEQLLAGGRVAVAIAPAGFAEQSGGLQQVVAIGDGDGGARTTAEALAAALGATVVPVANEDVDLLVVDSRAEAEQGRVSISSSASHLIEIARAAVLVVPRGVTIPFGGRTAPLVA